MRNVKPSRLFHTLAPTLPPLFDKSSLQVFGIPWYLLAPFSLSTPFITDRQISPQHLSYRSKGGGMELSKQNHLRRHNSSLDQLAMTLPYTSSWKIPHLFAPMMDSILHLSISELHGSPKSYNRRRGKSSPSTNFKANSLI